MEIDKIHKKNDKKQAKYLCSGRRNKDGDSNDLS